MTPDSIERETSIAAPVERVWSLLTEAEHITDWFAFGGAEIDLRPGGAIRFRWEEYGEFHGVVDAVEPSTRFAFRWALSRDAAPAEGNSTSVEFTLAAVGDGTRLRVVERGFAALAGSDSDRARHIADNTQGWAGAFESLQQQAERLAV